MRIRRFLHLAIIALSISNISVAQNMSHTFVVDGELQAKSDNIKVYNGNISGTNSAINGQYGTIEIYGGNLTSIDDKTLYTKYSPITVDNGTITSTNSTAIVTPSNLTINNGTITGKIAIANEEVIYSDRITTINNGHIIGTENAAIEITGTSSTNKVVVKGGTIEGATNGINTTQTLVIGQDNNTINTDSPVIIGHGQYAINVEYYTAFYDGILKGRQTGYHGLISIIPDGSLIKNDYESFPEHRMNFFILLKSLISNSFESLFRAQNLTFNKDVMLKSTEGGFTNATDAADYLVSKGIPFRDAHGIIGKLVLYCSENGKTLSQLSLKEYKAISPAFEEDIFDAVSIRTCIDKRITKGAPGSDAVRAHIESCEKYLNNI